MRFLIRFISAVFLLVSAGMVQAAPAAPVLYSGAPECKHTGSGSDFAVGPNQPYQNITDVPWEKLRGGDTVRIFYREAPYYEKIVISTNGTAEEPIRICGVPGPDGQRPILDGQQGVNRPADAQAYSDYEPMQGLAVILIWNRDYDLKVHNVTIEGLHIRNARSGFSYVRTDGREQEYETGAACIRVQAGDNIVIRDNELETCGSGIFTMSQEYNEASLTRNILIEGNYLHNNGEPGTGRSHGVYIQAIGATYQFNRFGPNNPDSHGVSLKERVAGSVIRYNWFDSGSSRVLDLVEVEDAAAWYIEQAYLDSLDGAEPDPERLEKVRQAEAAYRNTYVYGNFFRHIGSTTDAGNLIHYGYDNDPQLARRGVLYFFNNTLMMLNDREDSWRIRLFDVYLYDESAGTPAQETVEAFNNIFYLAPETPGQEPSYLCIGRESGLIKLGTNWISDGWQTELAQSECYPYETRPRIEGAENLRSRPAQPAPVDTATLDPLPASDALASPQKLPEALAAHVPDLQYVPHLTARPRGPVTILGARQFP